MFTNVNEQFTLGTHAERMPTNPADFPNGHVWYEIDTKVAVIALNGTWEPFSAGALAGAVFGRATIPAGQVKVDVPIAGLTVAADPMVSILGTAPDATVVGVQAGVDAPGVLSIVSTTIAATGNVDVVYFIPSVV